MNLLLSIWLSMIPFVYHAPICKMNQDTIAKTQAAWTDPALQP